LNGLPIGKGWVDMEFTEGRIRNLINNHGWEPIRKHGDIYFLRQKDKHYMKTETFNLPEGMRDQVREDLRI
jgi:hypothetical protein